MCKKFLFQAEESVISCEYEKDPDRGNERSNYMKKILRAIAFTLAALMLIVPAIAEENARPGITAHKANGIVIDGSLEDWNLDSPAVVNDASQLIRDGHLWKGADDLSVTFYLSWDEDNLFFAADVTEDTPLGAIEMLPIDGEDNLKLYISTDPAADPDRTSYGTCDFLIYFLMDEGFWSTAIDRSMITDKETRCRFVSKGMDGGENVLNVPDSYACAITKTTTGFIWEAKIPWGCLSEENTEVKKNTVPRYNPAVGDVLLCDFAITDIDYPCPGTEYIPQMAWTGNQGINTNPSLWGMVTLAE